MQIQGKPGAIYFLKGKEDGQVHELVAGIRSLEYRLLVVSPRDRAIVKNEFDGAAECILTLTESAGQDSIDPQNLMVLTDSIIKFVELEGPSGLLIEDLWLLKQNNEFPKVLRLVGFIYESLAINRGIGLIMIGNHDWNEREMAYLGKEGVFVEEKDRLDIGYLNPHSPKTRPVQNV
jgi:hypothetical protein